MAVTPANDRTQPSSDAAELISIRAQVGELARRIELVGDHYRASDDSAVQSDIDAAERNLLGATRSLDRAIRTLDGMARRR